MHIAAIAAKCTGPVIKKLKRRIYIASNIRQASTNRRYSISTFQYNRRKGGDSTAVLAAGIPNISGSTRISTQSAALGCYWPEGVFYAKGNNNLGIPDANQTQPVSDLGFSAALSSNIYGASDTVQPPALSLIPQIKY